MQSISDTRNHDNPTKTVIITDLDQSDLDMMGNSHRKVQKKRTTERKQKTMRTMTGNFNRSHSAECHVREAANVPTEGTKSKSSKTHGYLHELLQSKEQEIEKMFERVVTLQNFNEQFAVENKKLQQHVKMLEQKMEQLQQDIQNCAGCEELSLQLTRATNHNKELTADLSMLKNLIYRLNVQIESYQDKLRHKEQAESTTIDNEDNAGNAKSTDSSQFSAKIKKSWQFSEPLYRHTLGPLLQSYDEMIRDKEELFQQYKTEFEHFSGELKRVLEDNNDLLAQHELLKREVGNWREERARLQAAVDVCRKKAEAHAQKADITKEKLVEVVNVYEQRLQSQALELEHIQSAYTRCKSELMQMKSMQAQSPDTMTTALQQCKELLEQLKKEHGIEKAQLHQQIADLNKRSASSEGKYKALKQENSELKLETQQQSACMTELKQQYALIKKSLEHVERSRARLKARLRIALQWAQKLERGQSEIQGTWDALKRLETIVKHKESQVRGLHARHLEEIAKLQKKLQAKEDTIRTILRSKVAPKVQHSEDDEDAEESG